MWYVNFFRRSLCALMVSALVAGGSFASGATITFDDFDAPAPAQYPVIGATAAIINTTDPGIQGGQREVTFEVSGPPAMPFVGQVGGGALGFNSASPGAVATVKYEGLGGANLNLMGDMFAFDFGYVDNNVNQNLVVAIDVISAGGTATGSGTIADINTPSTATVDFASFTGHTAVLGNANSVVLRFNPGAYEHIDFSLNSFAIRTIPEPSIAFMLVSSLLAAMFFVRRR